MGMRAIARKFDAFLYLASRCIVKSCEQVTPIEKTLPPRAVCNQVMQCNFFDPPNVEFPYLENELSDFVLMQEIWISSDLDCHGKD
jgi:hypothetical protein